MRVLSRESTDLAYDGVHYDEQGRPVHPRRKGKVVIRPGYNTISAEGEALLRNDQAFAGHVENGHMVIGPEGDVEAGKADEFHETEEVLPADPRAQLDGETPAAWKKRLKAMDDATAVADKPRVDFLASFAALDAPAQEAALPTLTDEQREWVAADRASKAGA